MSPLRWTRPRRDALAVLAYGHEHGQPVYESNITMQGSTRLTIYWQTLRWLIDEGLATMASREVSLTNEGRRIVAAADRQTACDSDGEAQAVCRALAEHERHGGAIPWPSVSKPFEAWKAQQE